MNKINPIFSAMTDIDNSIITDAQKPRKSPKVIIIAAAAAAAAGIALFAVNYNPTPYGSGIATADEPDLHPTLIDYSEVKEGYYLSDKGNDSYIVIKDGKFTVVGFDWEEHIRKDDLPEDIGMEKGTSEYEEYISKSVKASIKDFTDVTFVPVKFYGYPEGFSLEGMLVRDIPADEIESAGRFSGLGMKGEDKLFFGEDNFYTYYGTSLPE